MIKRFLLSEVRLEDPYMRRAQETILGFIKKMDPDRVLCVFRRTAGLSDKGASPYPGWENSKIGGHALGHYFSAMAMAVSFLEDEKLSSDLSYMVSSLKECQNAYGSGFLSAASPVNAENPEFSFDVEEGKVPGEIVKDSWVPWYAFHKVIAGMTDVYIYTGNKEALEVACAMADWACNRAGSWDEKTHQRILSTEYGGMNEVLYKLYEITGNDAYKAGAEAFDDLPLYRRFSYEKDALSGVHANTTIPKYLGAIRRYLADTTDSECLELTKAFFHRVVSGQTYITGGIGDIEHFRPDGQLDHNRTQCNAESCCVYNMMKLAQELFFITKDTFYLDYYEKALRNARMGSWHPKGGTTYFNPLGTGFFKVFGNPDPDENVFWCCTGTGMEDFMKLADGIFYHDDERLYICNYIASTLSFTEKELTVRLEADVKKSDRARFTLKNRGQASRELTLFFRIPDWVKGKFTVSGDGECAEADGFISTKISIEPGEEKVFEINFPMALSAYDLPDAPNVLSFTCGPTVLAARLPEADGKETASAGIDVIAPKWKRIGFAGVKSDIVYGHTNRSVLIEEYLHLPKGLTLDEAKKDPSSILLKTEEGFVLKDEVNHEIRGLDAPLTFVPYDEITDERYGIYWNFD